MKYEAIYAAGRNALGAANARILAALSKIAPARVLDIGAGQGRDALAAARLGHRVHAVDISPTGLAQIAEDARAQRLAITCERSDLNKFSPSQPFDVLIADRTLHMLDAANRAALFERLLDAAAPGATVLIEDEARIIAALEKVADAHARVWICARPRAGSLVLHEDV